MKYHILSHAIIVVILLFLNVAPAGSVQIIEKKTLDFATLLIPIGSAEFIRVYADNSAPTGTGTIVSGSTQRGKYKIKDNTNNGTFTLDIQNISTGNQYIKLKKFKGIYDGLTISSFPVGGLQRKKKKKNLFLGARVRYKKQVPEGLYGNMTFDIVHTIE